MKSNLQGEVARAEQVLPGRGRLLAVDYGPKRTGLALTDPLQMTASAYETIESRRAQAPLWELIKAICAKKEVVGIVVGKPTNMDGSEGKMVEEAMAFAQLLHEKLGLPVVAWDERMTSLQAQRFLRSMGKKPSRHKAAIDKLAATFILRSYLDSRRT